VDVVWPQGDDKHDDHNRRPIYNRCAYYHYHYDDSSPDDYYVNHHNHHNDYDHHNDGCSDNHDLCPR
jgi:hypothetical protein